MQREKAPSFQMKPYIIPGFSTYHVHTTRIIFSIKMHLTPSFYYQQLSRSLSASRANSATSSSLRPVTLTVSKRSIPNK